MKRFQIGLALSPIVFVLAIAVALAGCVTPAVIGGALTVGGQIAVEYGEKAQKVGEALK